MNAGVSRRETYHSSSALCHALYRGLTIVAISGQWQMLIDPPEAATQCQMSLHACYLLSMALGSIREEQRCERQDDRRGGVAGAARLAAVADRPDVPDEMLRRLRATFATFPEITEEHAWVGVRDILMDYVKHDGLRLALQVLTVLLLAGYAGWTIEILWR